MGHRTLAVMTEPQRVVVQGHSNSRGLWTVFQREVVGYKEHEPPPFSMWYQTEVSPDGLSDDLLADLQEWNDRASATNRDTAGTEWLYDLHERARHLAERVQDEVGPTWEVLYSAGEAWHWVARPHGWTAA
jgi:hypothetical protein